MVQDLRESRAVHLTALDGRELPAFCLAWSCHGLESWTPDDVESGIRVSADVTSLILPATLPCSGYLN